MKILNDAMRSSNAFWLKEAAFKLKQLRVRNAYGTRRVTADVRMARQYILSALDALESDTRLPADVVSRKAMRMEGDLDYKRPKCVHCERCFGRVDMRGQVTGEYVSCAAFDDRRRPLAVCNRHCCEYEEKEVEE